MTVLISLLFTMIVQADAPKNWDYLTDIRDRHEFYVDHESIIKPKDSWQTLFSVIYLDKSLSLVKDCVLFRVPGAQDGVLKIITTTSTDECEKHLLEPGNTEWEGVKSLKFSTANNRIALDMNLVSRNETWIVNPKNTFAKPEVLTHLSSTELKASKLILLAPEASVKPLPIKLLSKGTLCHKITDDCEEVTPSVCDDCIEGWYEIPNGCATGPKYCGRQQCGQKGQYACRKGMKWQRVEEKFDCRVNSSFAFCSEGLTVTCEGHQAFCR